MHKMSKNNIITFSNEGIAVLYGPNGTGKTSLVKVLTGEKGTSVKYEFENVKYSCVGHYRLKEGEML